ncbi:MAG TPA: TetR/AcrR family transcriptional regulator [Solirubrobacteraceae bacterium]|nr:TetR/AcrR family transcriptional regulator [Solirubrobacteraceae bacterium]
MTITPWGDATQLRARRLRPGPGADPSAVTRNQRERMYSAMVATIAENGYEATRVADVVKLSGVSRSAFYKHFEDKLDCFLATLDEVAELAFAQLAKRYDPDLPWETRLRVVADAFLDLLLEQPAAARLCLVEVYAAGPPAVERLDRAVATVESEIARAFRESPERAGMPRDVIRAIAGGLLKTVQTRLRRGEQVELIEQLPQLLDWGLSYEAPPEPLRRPRRKPDRGAAPLPDPTVPRERLVTAITDTIAERGYPDTTIIEIAERASASLSTFYGNFENKGEALLAALDREREQSLTAAWAAVEAAPDWPRGIRAGLDALLGFFAAEPAAASVAIVDAFTAGAEGPEGGDQTIWAFHVFLEPGYELAPDTPPLTSEAVGNAVYSLVYGQIRADRVERMRELAPTATFVALAPFTGSATACAVANA